MDRDLGRGPTLKGLAWGHTRGLLPMIATAHAWVEQHQGVAIQWEHRSLQQFGEGSLDEAVDSYDLVVVDHPYTGALAETSFIRAFDDYLSKSTLDDIARGALEPTYESYGWSGKQWALPIDAAAQVSAFRPDLMVEAGEAIPQTWDEVAQLAHRTGRVALPLMPIDVFSAFFSLCSNLGGHPGAHPQVFIGKEVGIRAWDVLRALKRNCGNPAVPVDPPGLLREMSISNAFVYCPLTFGYSNYSRAGYAAKPIAFGPIPNGGHGGTLGGAGVALTRSCRAPELASSYCAWMVGSACQRSIYVEAGGQPAHRDAWDDSLANLMTANFFTQTRSSITSASMRPRFAGFARWQHHTADLLQRFLFDDAAGAQVLDAVNSSWKLLRKPGHSSATAPVHSRTRSRPV